MTLDRLNRSVSKIQIKIMPVLGKIESNQYFRNMKNAFLYFNYILLVSSVIAIAKQLNLMFIHNHSFELLVSKALLLLTNNCGWLFLAILCFLLYREHGNLYYYICSSVVYLLVSGEHLSDARTELLLLPLLALLVGFVLITGYQFILKSIKKRLNIPMKFLDNLLLMLYFGFAFLGCYLLTRYWSQLGIRNVINEINIDNPFMVFLIVFLETFLWYIGVNGYGILAPVVLLFATSNLNANFHAMALGETPKYIFTPNFWDYFLSATGAGITGALVILTLLSKKAKLRQLGRSSIGGACFSVSEPIIFGIPVVMNPYFFFPLVVGTPILGVVQWFVFKMGWVALPTYFVADMPLPFAALLATLDWRSLILTLGTIGLATLMYWPFFKAFEANYVETKGSHKYDDLDLDF